MQKNIRIVVFFVVTPLNLAEGYKCLRGTYCFYHQGWTPGNRSSVFFPMVGTCLLIKQRHNPQDHMQYEFLYSEVGCFEGTCTNYEYIKVEVKFIFVCN
jgi:hypothetical protein